MVADPDLADAVARSFLGTLPPELVDELLLQQTAINAFGSVRQRVAGRLLDLASAQQRPEGRLVATAPDRVVIVDAVTDIRRRRRQSACVSLIESQLMRRQPWQPFRTP